MIERDVKKEKRCKLKQNAALKGVHITQAV